MHRRVLPAFAALAASFFALQPWTGAHAADCTARAEQEIDTINRRAASAKDTNDTATLCRGIAEQIKSYEFIIGLFNNPDCRASDPKAGIAQMNAKVGPLRTAYAQYCRR